jgi:hypothetical protein
MKDELKQLQTLLEQNNTLSDVKIRTKTMYHGDAISNDEYTYPVLRWIDNNNTQYQIQASEYGMSFSIEYDSVDNVVVHGLKTYDEMLEELKIMFINDVKTIQVDKFKGLIIPDDYESEGLKIKDGLTREFVESPYQKLQGDYNYQISLELARQLHGCLIMVWECGTDEVTVKLTSDWKGTLLTEIAWCKDAMCEAPYPLHTVAIKGDIFYIAENEGKDVTLIINRPEGLYQ